MKEKVSWTEYVQPAMMATASVATVISCAYAIIIGADRTKDGESNPFFYVAMANSGMYAMANLYKIGQIYKSRCNSFVEQEGERRINNELTELLVK